MTCCFPVGQGIFTKKKEFVPIGIQFFLSRVDFFRREAKPILTGLPPL